MKHFICKPMMTVFAVTVVFTGTHCHQEDLDLNHFIASNEVSKNICVYRLHRISFPCTSTVQTHTSAKTTSLSLATSRNLWKIIYEETRNAELIARDHLIRGGSQILFHPFQVSLILCKILTTNIKH